jgi:acetoacetyl-CoA synthetase
MDNSVEKVLWKPTKNQIKQSQMTDFTKYINEVYKLSIQNYNDLHTWSVQKISDFWFSFCKYSDIVYTGDINTIIDNPMKMPGAKWFSGIRLNFAENLLRHRNSNTAIIFKGEGRKPHFLSYNQLYNQVEKLAGSFKQVGVQPGDRVVGYLPNMPIAIIAMLATASIGAVWSSCSPDFGIKGVLDRFQQIKPKLLFTVDGYTYNGKDFYYLDKVKQISEQLKTLKYVVINPYKSHSLEIDNIPNGITYNKFLQFSSKEELTFEQLPFDHPLYIMYSSGTTGMPKAIVHSAGGTLLQHLKELRLHTNLKQNDSIFYFTTCGWMMWNWLVSALATGATVVLYDGSPFFPDGNTLWNLIDEIGITVFGTSAKYLASCKSAGINPMTNNDLSTLRAILSTGSPLAPESFEYVYNEVKKDVMLSSIAGGTDIISCFVLGNPNLPVYRGEIQCKGLGMDVHSFSTSGESIIGEQGELVCTTPFPSMPIYFWNDDSGEKYYNAYFNKFPNIWHHGDYISISKYGGVTMHGRSDATLNPGGVRIGTSEIYQVVENFIEVVDSLVIGQDWNNDERVILFIKLADKRKISDDLVFKIKQSIKSNCSPRHVPAKILQTPDIPYTINGKKVEIAVKKIISGKDVSNRDALANPQSLDYYKDLKELKY